MEKHTPLSQYEKLIAHLQWLLLCIGVLTAPSINAQEQTIPFNRPGDERTDILKNKPFEPKPQPQLQLPPIKKTDSTEKLLSHRLQIDIKQIEFEGNTAFTREQLDYIVKDYIGQKVDTLELQQIRLAVTQHYINNGYINSGAVIPDQDVAQGILQINVIEGQLSDIIVANNGRLNDVYISDRIRLDKHHPLDLTQLQERLYLLQQDPRIKRINANLAPGATRGDSTLNIAITEEKPYNLSLNINNHRPPSVGEEQAILAFNHLNVSGAGDNIDLRFSVTEGLENSYVNYNWPLLANDTMLNLSYETSDSEVIEDTFKALDIDSESYTGSIGVTVPLFKSSSEAYTVSVKLDKRRSETQAFNGSTLDVGINRVSALRLTQSWLQHKNNEVYSFRHTLSVGIDALDATRFKPGRNCERGQTDNNCRADSDYTAWLLQFQWAKRHIPVDIQTIFRTDLQVAMDNLMSMEQFAVGGANTVRGYRENQLVRDNGFIASWEIRKLVYRNEAATQELQLVGFTDYGRSWNKNSDKAENIYSVGTGIKWTWQDKAAAELFWAKALNDVNDFDDSLQDDGIHINLIATIL